MYFGPKLWNMWIARRKDTQKKKKKTEEAKGEEELTTLVTDQPASPEKVTTQGAPVIPRPLSEDLPEAPAVPDTPRKTSNAYTPYKSMKGSARPSDDVKPPDITPKRPTAPLPELPGGAKGGGGKAEGKGGGGGGGKAEEPEPPDEVYINQDAHVYEGVRHDLPIYENRDVRMYESLKVAKK
nr:hypothetical protein BaRGS_013686 [Batillaria attramentaria]